MTSLREQWEKDFGYLMSKLDNLYATPESGSLNEGVLLWFIDHLKSLKKELTELPRYSFQGEPMKDGCAVDIRDVEDLLSALIGE